MSCLKDLLQGFRFVIAGTYLLFKVPRLLVWALIPFVFAIVLVSTSLAFMASNIGAWATSAVGYIIGASTGWLFSLIFYPLYFVFAIGFTVVTVYVVFVLMTVIASPFYSVLSEKTLVHQGALEEPGFHLGHWIRSSLKMLWISLVRAAIFLGLGVVIFIFSFIPFLNLLASFAALLVIAFDCMDYSFETKQMNLRQRFAYFKAHFWHFSGMAGFLGLTLLVPGLTLLTLPSAVVGAAMLLGDSHDDSSSSSQAHRTT